MFTANKHYLVVECVNCRRFLLAMSTNETRTCPYCGKRLRMRDAKVIARSETAEGARLVLQGLKAREGQANSADSSGRFEIGESSNGASKRENA